MANASHHHAVRHPINETMTAVDAAYVLVSNLTAFLSVGGCLVIFSVYFAWKEIRTTSRLLLVCLSFADFFVGLSTLLQTGTYYKNLAFPSQDSFLCQTASGLLVYSQMCAALWTVAVSFYLFLCVSGHCVVVANRILFLFHVFCWLMPLVVSLAADLSGVYGYDTTDILLYHHPTSCWISDRVGNALSWYLLTVEGWVMAAFIIVSVLYLPITWSAIRMKDKGKEIAGDDVINELAIQTANAQLRFVPAIYVCTRIWGTAYFLFTRYPDDRHLRASDWLMMIKAIGDNSQGLANAIFFCLATREIRQLMANRMRQCCSCFSGWCRQQRIIGKEKWMKVPAIVRARATGKRRSRNLDGSDLDLSGISLDLPAPDADLGVGDDEVLFERKN